MIVPVYIFFIEMQMAKVRKLKMKQLTLRNGEGYSQTSAVRLIKHRPVFGRSSFGTRKFFVRYLDVHRSVHGLASVDLLRVLFRNIPVPFRNRKMPGRALYGARTVAVKKYDLNV